MCSCTHTHALFSSPHKALEVIRLNTHIICRHGHAHPRVEGRPPPHDPQPAAAREARLHQPVRSLRSYPTRSCGCYRNRGLHRELICCMLTHAALARQGNRSIHIPSIRATQQNNYTRKHREVFYEQASDGFSSDIWSLAVVLYTFLTGHPLYSSPWDPAFLALSSGVRQSVTAPYTGKRTKTRSSGFRTLIVWLFDQGSVHANTAYTFTHIHQTNRMPAPSCTTTATPSAWPSRPWPRTWCARCWTPTPPTAPRSSRSGACVRGSVSIVVVTRVSACLPAVRSIVAIACIVLT